MTAVTIIRPRKPRPAMSLEAIEAGYARDRNVRRALARLIKAFPALELTYGASMPMHFAKAREAVRTPAYAPVINLRINTPA